MKTYLTVCLLIAGTSLYSQKTFERIQIRDNVHILYGGNGFGSNVGILVGQNGVLLVDAMKANASDSLECKIRELTDSPVTRIINTHSDFDHMEGNDFFREKGAKSLLHENAIYEGKEGDEYFTERKTVLFGGEEVELYHVESHSFSDVLIYFKTSNVLFMGDTYTNSWYATFNTGGLKGQLEAIRLAMELTDENTIVVPGHGILDNREGMMKYAETSQNWVARVAELHANGMSVDKMLMDDQLEIILNEFVASSLNKTIPLQRVRRFIERTITTDLMPCIFMSEDELSKYQGKYEAEEVVLKNGKLLLRMTQPYVYQVELLPLSETTFHPRATLGSKVIFTLDSNTGTPMQMSYENEGEETLTFSKE